MRALSFAFSFRFASPRSPDSWKNEARAAQPHGVKTMLNRTAQPTTIRRWNTRHRCTTFDLPVGIGAFFDSCWSENGCTLAHDAHEWKPCPNCGIVRITPRWHSVHCIRSETGKPAVLALSESHTWSLAQIATRDMIVRPCSMIVSSKRVEVHPNMSSLVSDDDAAEGARRIAYVWKRYFLANATSSPLYGEKWLS